MKKYLYDFKRGDVLTRLNFFTGKPMPDRYHVLATSEDLSNVLSDRGVVADLVGMAVCLARHYQFNRDLTPVDIHSILMRQEVGETNAKGIEYVSREDYILVEPTNNEMKYLLEKAEDL